MNIDLRQGDCLELMKRLGDNSVDLILTDPPYGTTACKWDNIIAFEPMWQELKRIAKKKAVICLFGNQPFTSALIMSNPKMFKYSWVWLKNKKTGFLNVKKQPLRQTEDIVVFYSQQATYNPQKTEGHKPVNFFTKHTSDGTTVGKTKIGITGGGQTDRYPSNVLPVPVLNNDSLDKLHPTQKPVALLEYLIKTYTHENETVLDFTMGSGTTGVASINLNRNFIGYELDPEYFKIAEARIQNAKDKIDNELFI